MFLMFISTIALTIVALTMLVRANDLRWKKGLVWNARLVGFICAGFAPIGVVIWGWYYKDYPTFYEAAFHLGVSLVFLTTPSLPPWWKLITGLGLIEQDDGQ